MYTAVARRFTRSVHAVNGRLYGHIHGTYTVVHTGHKHGRLHGRKHGRVHGHGWTMYMARARPCTQSVHGRGRVPCTCTCLWPVYTAVHGRVQTAYGPCIWSLHDQNAAAAPAPPCLQPVPCTRPFTACTYRVHHVTVHSSFQASQKLTTETSWTAITQIQ